MPEGRRLPSSAKRLIKFAPCKAEAGGRQQAHLAHVSQKPCCRLRMRFQVHPCEAQKSQTPHPEARNRSGSTGGGTKETINDLEGLTLPLRWSFGGFQQDPQGDITVLHDAETNVTRYRI